MENEELTLSQKHAVNSYLFKWFAALGLVNVAALLTGLSYIFFVIPQEAASKANILISEEINRQISPLKDDALRSTSEALTQSARVQERANFMFEETNELAKAVRTLKNNLNDIKKDDVLKVKEVSDYLLANPNIDRILGLEERVSSVESRRPQWPDGKYCILREKTDCPVGFTQIDTRVTSSALYNRTTEHFQPTEFGSSSIQSAHNSKPYFSVKLSVCCK